MYQIGEICGYCKEQPICVNGLCRKCYNAKDYKSKKQQFELSRKKDKITLTLKELGQKFGVDKLHFRVND